MGAAGPGGQEVELSAAEVRLPAGRSRVLAIHSRTLRAMSRPVSVSTSAQDEGETHRPHRGSLINAYTCLPLFGTTLSTFPSFISQKIKSCFMFYSWIS